jgi:hypothetical protein
MTNTATADSAECWPALPLDSWRETCDTLHMWTQIVGKVRMRLTPLVNHWWNVPLYVTPRGLTTSNIPYGTRSIEIRFDFLAGRLVLECSDGLVRELPLRPMAVADFYREFMVLLRSAGVEVSIWHMPVEVPDPIPFDEDRVHAAYDAERVKTFWCILRSVDAVFHQFRARFEGKASPVHFFWGSFDLAVTSFSGRKAPERPGADSITREAYSHEVSSVGWWPGSGTMSGPAFYSYSAPEPQGFKAARVRPDVARYDAELGEFLLPYDDVRNAESPSAELLAFCQSTYDAAAELGKWDRRLLEREEVRK